ncbi:exodeoxyribonuclease VII small subunit [Larsenimonas rhizosphaerae]|uniref:Exodeoxyribonuclease 7 small subunit n=1 Tax=Larsenimonas rhizosphaerae TaxID=2944682 RepID=A0AA41ZG48_9GAMM|nr:exodeoxyribonuclease VII small subunit [Larsenimonas rhizosphaerae]MCM2129486.1 exodeoxyribonuclease VII small subunit [Larsenimonas rhizosphaerae]MCX2524142.1 exodeoxyribonuclease VII small subunit [Larsenimonas rhizosphaerae]
MAEQDVTPPEAPDFAATLAELETVVTRLESGELSLEDSLTAFEQGVRLTRTARERLTTAELRVQALMEQGDGRVQETPLSRDASATTDDDRQGGR